MKTGRFRHKVEIDVELTGLDLVILEYHAKRHYDGTCERFFTQPTQMRTPDREGFGWLQDWQGQEWRSRTKDDPEAQYTEETMRRPEENLEFAATVTVTERSLDLCMKIIERLGADVNWTLIGELMGREMPEIEQKMSVLVLPLRYGLKDAFFKIQEEWKRLDEAAKPAPKLGEKLECPSCSSSNLEWQEYVLHTRPILGVKGTEVGVDMAGEKSEYESCKDEGLACKDCFDVFPVPEGLKVDHTELHEFEEKAG